MKETNVTKDQTERLIAALERIAVQLEARPVIVVAPYPPMPQPPLYVPYSPQIGPNTWGGTPLCAPPGHTLPSGHQAIWHDTDRPSQ